ncbi:hypothetical protein CO704_21725 [Cedecea neteri]|uniref:Uncharacterized protein n=1 Tax=Cedecea neteri TaxID=158822 RepID=A0A291E3I6_9ENTR|nr:hypothetical protein CO704_21725 [Cedecea neteri]
MIAILSLLLAVLAVCIVLMLKSRQGTQVECSGQIHSVFGDNQTLPEFRGIYTLNLEKQQGFLSINGSFRMPDATYTVQRVTRVMTAYSGNQQGVIELKPVSEHVLTGDNLPEELYRRYIFSPVSVITVNKTLPWSWLIRNLYSPVLVCTAD